MGVDIHHTIDRGEIAAMLRNPGGGVARDMLRRGVRVQSQARRNLRGGAGKPRRWATGQLAGSIYVKPVTVGGNPAVWVGTGVRHAKWVHNGTGIYGPRRRPIRPTRGKYLVFTPKGAKGKIFVREVKGMRPNPFLADALSAARY